MHLLTAAASLTKGLQDHNHGMIIIGLAKLYVI